MPNTLTQNAQIIDEAVADIKDEIALKGVTVPDPCPITTIPSLIESISGGGGGQDTQQLIGVIQGNISTLSIPSGTSYIIDNAFADFSLLTTVILPNGLTTIGYGSFSNCFALASINFPSSLDEIGEGAFANTLLTSVDLSNTQISIINPYTFSGCEQLATVYLPESLKYDGVIATKAFENCSSLTDIYYAGTRAEWEQISIDEDAIPERVTIHCIDDNV